MRDNHSVTAPIEQRAFCKASPLAHLLLTIRGTHTAAAPVQSPSQQLAAHPLSAERPLDDPSPDITTVALNGQVC